MGMQQQQQANQPLMQQQPPGYGHQPPRHPFPSSIFYPTPLNNNQGATPTHQQNNNQGATPVNTTHIHQMAPQNIVYRGLVPNNTPPNTGPSYAPPPPYLPNAQSPYQLPNQLQQATFMQHISTTHISTTHGTGGTTHGTGGTTRVTAQGSSIPHMSAPGHAWFAQTQQGP